MKTLGDVIKLVDSMNVSKELFGHTAEWERERINRTQAVGEAIVEEQGIMPEAADTLSEDTPLGEKSLKLATELEAWYKNQVAQL